MRSNVKAVPLFENLENLAFEQKIRSFAREVAKRHRGRPGDRAALVAALRGYYRTWAIFERLPVLDERSITLAVAEYEFVRSGRRHENVA